MTNSFVNLFNHHQFRQYLAVLTATFAFVSCGMNIVWPAAVLPQLLSDNPPVLLSIQEISWVISIMNLSNMVSPYPCGFLMDRYGRKKILLILSILPITGWVLIIVGETTLVVCTARFLIGLWQGVVSTVLPVYIAEIAEPKFRSQMGTFISFMIYLGLLITYIIGPLLSYTGIAIANGMVPIIFFLSFIWMPESPVYYIIHKDHVKAEKSLTWFRGNLEKEKIIMELEATEKSATKDMENKGGIMDIFKTRGTIKALIISSGLAFFQRYSGIFSVILFSSTTLPESGFFFISRNQFIIVLGVILVAFTLITSFLIKHFGNVPLLGTSSIGCAIIMFVLGLWFYLISKSENLPKEQLFEWIPYVCLASYAIFYSLGLGSITNSIRGELFPTNIRAVSSALTTNSGSLTSFIQTKTYYQIAEMYGMHVNYWFNSTCCIASTIFVFSYVIETKGKSLNEIQEELQRKD